MVNSAQGCPICLYQGLCISAASFIWEGMQDFVNTGMCHTVDNPEAGAQVGISFPGVGNPVAGGPRPWNELLEARI